MRAIRVVLKWRAYNTKAASAVAVAVAGAAASVVTAQYLISAYFGLIHSDWYQIRGASYFPQGVTIATVQRHIINSLITVLNTFESVCDCVHVFDRCVHVYAKCICVCLWPY